MLYERWHYLSPHIQKAALTLLSFLLLVGCKLEFPEQW